MRKEASNFVLNFNAVKSGDLIKVLPLGEIKGRDGRYWVLSEEDAVSLVEIVKQNGVDLVLDWEHHTYEYPADGKAAGWFKADSFVVDPQGPDGPGIYAEIEFTPQGEESVVVKKEYKYFSPVFWSQGTRIVELESFGLSNIPNIPDLPALNRKQTEPANKNSKGGKDMDLEREVNRLKKENEDLLQEKNKLQKERDELLMELNKLQGELEAFKQKEQEREVNEMVEKAISDGKLAPAQKETALRLGLNSKELLEELINSTPYDYRKLKTETENRDQNRKEVDELTLEVCKMLGIKPEELKKENSGEA